MSNISPNISYFSQRIIEIGEVYTPLYKWALKSPDDLFTAKKSVHASVF
jgi:hypothetical protein